MTIVDFIISNITWGFFSLETGIKDSVYINYFNKNEGTYKDKKSSNPMIGGKRIRKVINRNEKG